MRNGKATTTKRGRATTNATRKLGDLQLTTCTYRRTIQMDHTISLLGVLYSDASFPHTYILVCDPTVSDRKSIHSYVILRNVRFSSETPPLRKISVRYVRNIRSKNLTFAVVLRRYRMKVFMFFTKLVG